MSIIANTIVSYAPACEFCADGDFPNTPAQYLAPLSTDRGTTVTWMLLCEDHMQTFFQDTDWHPKSSVFELSRTETWDGD